MTELIEKITFYADSQYRNGMQCNTPCQYTRCPGNCEKCLEYCHFPNKAMEDGFEPRDYNCLRLVNFYICKYSYKYASEILYALRIINHIMNNKSFNVLSLGCGPCTDLMALYSIKQRKIFQINHLNYLGIELNPSLWAIAYSSISSTFMTNNIIQQNVSNIPDFTIYFKSDYLNIICINYLLSTIARANESQIPILLNNLANSINYFDGDIVVLFNDINLSRDFEGGIREYFNEFYSLLRNSSCIEKHFHTSKPHWHYGEAYSRNNLFYQTLINPDIYNPFTECGSAQLIVYKKRGNA